MESFQQKEIPATDGEESVRFWFYDCVCKRFYDNIFLHHKKHFIKPGLSQWIAQTQPETLPVGEPKNKRGRSGAGCGVGTSLLCRFRGFLGKSSPKKMIKREVFFLPNNKSLSETKLQTVWMAFVIGSSSLTSGRDLLKWWIAVFLTWSSNVETDVGFQANEDNKSCSQKKKLKKAKDLSNNTEMQ